MRISAAFAINGRRSTRIPTTFSSRQNGGSASQHGRAALHEAAYYRLRLRKYRPVPVTSCSGKNLKGFAIRNKVKTVKGRPASFRVDDGRSTRETISSWLSKRKNRPSLSEGTPSFAVLRLDDATWLNLFRGSCADTRTPKGAQRNVI